VDFRKKKNKQKKFQNTYGFGGGGGNLFAVGGAGGTRRIVRCSAGALASGTAL
jgi:hypothetical protein